MKRTKITKQRQADAILTADWHLRETLPICRTDDFLQAQLNKMIFIQDLQQEHNCPVIHAGDLFHYWKPSPFLLSQAFMYLPKKFCTVYGNHDLPRGNLDLAYKSGVATLSTAMRIEVLQGTHWGEYPHEKSFLKFHYGGELEGKYRNMLVWHKMVWYRTPPWPGCVDTPAEKVLSKYPQSDIILTGDNHTPFVAKHRDKLLVNPGSLTRQTADQETFSPRVYLWYAEKNEVEPVYLPIQEGVVTRAHIDHSEERDTRIQAFVEKLNKEWEAEMSFEANLKRFEDENQVRSSVMEIIRMAIDSEGD